uniref:Fibronectin type-III domain-containing protein n=1 Tax=Oncorhynchus mykiss TaxID=8022 RepID=A0A8C7TAS0_ONCMY
MWPRKVIVLLLYYYGCSAIGEGKPYFISRNFNTVLHWNKVDSPDEGVLYSVHYQRHGEPYKPKIECQNITTLSCDLTAETPYIYQNSYYAEVFADSHSLGRTALFKPLRDTILGPANVSVTPTTSSLKVTVTLPLGPDNKTSIEEIFNSTSFSYHYPPTLYILNITHPSWAAQVHKNTTGEFVLNHLKNNSVKYCGYVVYTPTREMYRNASESSTFCVVLPGEVIWCPSRLWCLLLGSFLLPVVVCRHYVRKKSNMPDALVRNKLTTSNVPPPLWHPPEAITFSIAKSYHYPVGFSYGDLKTGKLQMGPRFTSSGSGSYSPQDEPSSIVQPRHCDTYMGQQGPPPEHSNNSTQSSTNYSMVVVQVANEGVEEECHRYPDSEDNINSPWSSESSDHKPSCVQGGPVLFSRGAPPEPKQCVGDRKSTGHPLVLPTLRRIDGLLQLSTLLLQPETQSAMASMALPTDAEGQPLLRDLDSTGQGASLLSDLVTTGETEYLDPGTGREEERTIYTPISPMCFNNSNDSPSHSIPPINLADCETSSMTFLSGYKQHWVPLAPLGLTAEDNFGISSYAPQQAWIDQEEEVEKGEEGGDERIREFFLGGWVVQIL